MTSSVDQNKLSARLSEASALRNAGRTRQAIEAYRDVLSIEPSLPDSWFNLGWLYRRNGQPAEALRAYEQALKLSEAFVPAMFNLANTHEDLGCLEEPVELYQKILEIAPMKAEALYTRSSGRWRNYERHLGPMLEVING